MQKLWSGQRPFRKDRDGEEPKQRLRGEPRGHAHTQDQPIIALVGPLQSGKASFVHNFRGGLGRLIPRMHRPMAIEANVEGGRVTLLNACDLGCSVNGRIIVEPDVAAQVKSWLRELR